MTGYLHLRDDAELLEQLAVAAHDWEPPDCRHPDWRLSDCRMFAHSVLGFLRGLSVEPTEDKRSPERCRAYAAALMGVAHEVDDFEAAALLTIRAKQWEAEADRLVAAPVPVQEDR
jgi:hypothetical protein